MRPFGLEPVSRLRIPARDGGDPRPHPKHPHPPSVVAEVRHLVETTRLTFRTIGHRTGVNNGTISRWAEKHGWTRPPGAAPFARRPDRRYRPVLVGRALAHRLRVQAERLVAEIEAAPQVDPEALAEALALLARAREEQAIRRGRRRAPPPKTADADPPRKRKPHDRRDAALKGWTGRYSRRAQRHQEMLREG